MKLNAEVKTARTPNAPRAMLDMSVGAEGVGNNFLVFGAPATGKSTVGAQIACSGKKVFTCSTDLGNTGINGMLAYAKSVGKLEEFNANHKYIVLTTKHENELDAFIDDPASLVKGFWDFNPEFVLWDGLGFYVKNKIVPDTEEIVNTDQQLEGFEGNQALKAWGYVRNNIVRVLDSATAWLSPSKKPINRIFTTGVTYKAQVISGDPSKPDCVRSYLATEEPDIPTSAKRTLQFGFDMAFMTLRDPKTGAFQYKITGDYMKSRYKFKENILTADFMALYDEVERQRT